jgi:hypothetical protein
MKMKSIIKLLPVMLMLSLSSAFASPTYPSPPKMISEAEFAKLPGKQSLERFGEVISCATAKHVKSLLDPNGKLSVYCDYVNSGREMVCKENTCKMAEWIPYQ